MCVGGERAGDGRGCGGGGGQVCFPFYNSVIVLNSVDIMYNVCYHLFQ